MSKARAEVKGFVKLNVELRMRIDGETKPIVEATASPEARLSIGSRGLVESNYSTWIQRLGGSQFLR